MTTQEERIDSIKTLLRLLMAEAYKAFRDVFATKTELSQWGGTDTKVTSADNHYTPESDASAKLVAATEGSVSAYALGTQYSVVTGVNVQRDAKGHVTGVTINKQYVKDTNTTYSAGTAALLTAGTDTTSRVWTAKILADYVTSKTGGALTPAALGFGYGTCSTAASTTAKVVTLANYELVTGGYISVKFTYAVPASATLNVNSKGAKAIYYKGAAIKSGIIAAGETATFVYNGSYYHLVAIDTAIDVLAAVRDKTIVAD